METTIGIWRGRFATAAKANPTSSFSPLSETSTDSVSFRIARDGQKRGVILDAKTFESSLVNIPLSRCLVMGSIAYGAGRSDPAISSIVLQKRFRDAEFTLK